MRFEKYRGDPNRQEAYEDGTTFGFGLGFFTGLMLSMLMIGLIHGV